MVCRESNEKIPGKKRRLDDAELARVSHRLALEGEEGPKTLKLKMHRSPLFAVRLRIDHIPTISAVHLLYIAAAMVGHKVDTRRP